jgi:hypothetical protein
MERLQTGSGLLWRQRWGVHRDFFGGPDVDAQERMSNIRFPSLQIFVKMSGIDVPFFSKYPSIRHQDTR